MKSANATNSASTDSSSVYASATTVSAAMSSTMTSVSRNARMLRRPSPTDQREDPEREGSVGADRDAPAPRGGLAAVEREVDQGRRDHPTERGENGRRQPTAFAQLAHVELATDLETGDEEEERHQPVVDPVAEIERKLAAADPDRERGGPDLLVARRPRRVRPDERRDGRTEQDDRARVLRRNELPNSPGEPRQARSLLGPRSRRGRTRAPLNRRSCMSRDVHEFMRSARCGSFQPGRTKWQV